MTKRSVVSGITTMAVALFAVAAAAGAASAGVWQADHVHYGGVALDASVGDCEYTYDAILPGMTSSNKGYGWTVGESGCDAVRARLFYKDANWAGWTSWRSSANGIVESLHLSYAGWSGHQVQN